MHATEESVHMRKIHGEYRSQGCSFFKIIAVIRSRAAIREVQSYGSPLSDLCPSSSPMKVHRELPRKQYQFYEIIGLSEMLDSQSHLTCTILGTFAGITTAIGPIFGERRLNNPLRWVDAKNSRTSRDEQRERTFPVSAARPVSTIICQFRWQRHQ